MKNLTMCMLALISMAAINAQQAIKGNGNVVTIERTTTDYNTLRVGGFYDVELVEGSEGKIVIKGEENLMDYIETEIKGGVLTIKTRDNENLNPTSGKDILITVPISKINAMRLSGSGKLTNTKTIEADNFNIESTGSHKVELSLVARSLDLNTSGSSNVQIEGNADSIDFVSTGSSEIYAFEFMATRGKIKSSGSSSVKVSVNEILNTHVSGSSAVRYRGNPEKIINKISGSGEVSKD